MEGTAAATRSGRAWNRVPVCARVAVPLALAAGVYLGWLLAGRSAPMEALEPPDPTVPVACYAEATVPVHCVQGPGKHPISAVEPGEVCGAGMFWLETEYAAVFGSEVRYRCVHPPIFDTHAPPPLRPR